MGKPPRERDNAAEDDQDDASLFRDAIGPVRELPPTAAPPARPKPRPSPRMAQRDEAEAASEFRRALTAVRWKPATR